MHTPQHIYRQRGEQQPDRKKPLPGEQPADGVVRQDVVAPSPFADVAAEVHPHHRNQQHERGKYIERRSRSVLRRWREASAQQARRRHGHAQPHEQSKALLGQLPGIGDRGIGKRPPAQRPADESETARRQRPSRHSKSRSGSSTPPARFSCAPRCAISTASTATNPPQALAAIRRRQLDAAQLGKSQIPEPPGDDSLHKQPA